jgi:hypothetical protein
LSKERIEGGSVQLECEAIVSRAGDFLADLSFSDCGVILERDGDRWPELGQYRLTDVDYLHPGPRLNRNQADFQVAAARGSAESPNEKIPAPFRLAFFIP